MEQLKSWFGIGSPGGFDDLVIRAVKMAVFVFLSQPFGEALLGCARDAAAACQVDFSLAQSAAYAGAAAGMSVIFNSILLWASGGSGQKTGEPTEVDRDA